jgi:hypothetical protein
VKLKKERKTKTMKTIINKKSMLAGLTVGAMSLMLALPQAQANFSGAIGFGGSYTLLPGQNLGDATELLTISSFVSSDAGAYGSIPVPWAATFTSPLMISPATPASPLWTVVSGGNTYTFSATTSTVASQGPATGGYELRMQGKGDAWIDGTDETPGTWIVTASESGSTAHGGFVSFGFESTATVVGAVPDGGMTLGLLGSAMIAVAGLRRKLGC